MVGMSLSKNDTNTMKERWLKCHIQTVLKRNIYTKYPKRELKERWLINENAILFSKRKKWKKWRTFLFLVV